MVYVYVIYENQLKEIYIGMANDLDRRLIEHKRRKSNYTKKFSDFSLIYKEECDNYKLGRKREKYLKSGYGREFLKNLI